jgi:hypothetical protein
MLLDVIPQRQRLRCENQFSQFVGEFFGYLTIAIDEKLFVLM